MRFGWTELGFSQTASGHPFCIWPCHVAPFAREMGRSASPPCPLKKVIDSGLVGSTNVSFITSAGALARALGGVPREQKMLKGQLPRVIYHRVYFSTRRKQDGPHSIRAKEKGRSTLIREKEKGRSTLNLRKEKRTVHSQSEKREKGQSTPNPRKGKKMVHTQSEKKKERSTLNLRKWRLGCWAGHRLPHAPCQGRSYIYVYIYIYIYIYIYVHF